MPVPSWTGETGVEIQRELESTYGPGSFTQMQPLVMQHLRGGEEIELP